MLGKEGVGARSSTPAVAAGLSNTPRPTHPLHGGRAVKLNTLASRGANSVQKRSIYQPAFSPPLPSGEVALRMTQLCMLSSAQYASKCHIPNKMKATIR